MFLVAAILVAIQLAAVIALARLVGNHWPVLAGVGVLNGLFFLGMRNPWRDWARSRLWLYLGLWPFFAWAAFCLSLSLLLPVGLLAAWLTPIDVDQALAA